MFLFSLFYFIMLSKTGNEWAAAILGKPNPKIPAKGAPTKADPFSYITAPNI